MRLQNAVIHIAGIFCEVGRAEGDDAVCGLRIAVACAPAHRHPLSHKDFEDAPLVLDAALIGVAQDVALVIADDRVVNIHDAFRELGRFLLHRGRSILAALGRVEKRGLPIVDALHYILHQLLIPHQLAVAGEVAGRFVLDLDFGADLVAEAGFHHLHGVPLPRCIEVPFRSRGQCHADFAVDGGAVALEPVHLLKQALEGAVEVHLEGVEGVRAQGQHIRFVAHSHSPLLFIRYI